METIELHERRRGERCGDTMIVPQFTSAEAQETSDELQMLAHPIRLQILAILAAQPGQVCVCDLEALLPVKQPTVSHHLKLLRSAGLIDCERHGLWAYYFIQRDAVAALHARVAQQLDKLISMPR